MFQINIYGEPPSIEAIRQMRGSGNFEDSAAFKVLMFTPIPGVDILAALATYAYEQTVSGKDFKACDGAAKMDWSASTITESYVGKVRAQGRELINLEVDALKRHLALELPARAAASAAASAVADVAMKKGKEALSEAATAAASAAADAVVSGIKGLFGSRAK